MYGSMCVRSIWKSTHFSTCTVESPGTYVHLRVCVRTILESTHFSTTAVEVTLAVLTAAHNFQDTHISRVCVS